MDSLFNFIGSIFGYALMFIYNIFGNFGVAIIVFTIFTRLLLFPFTIKQQKTSAKMQRLQPKIKEIQQKYANDKEKQGEEMQKLYEREGASPTGGCGTMLIQLPVFYGLYRAICMPLTCTLHLSIDSGVLGSAIERVKSLPEVYTAATSSYYAQINIIEAVRNIGTDYAKFGFTQAEFEALAPIREMSSGFNFLGIDLLSIAQFWNPAIILTFLVFIASAGSMYLTNKLTGMSAQSMNGCSPNMMGIMMGLMSAWISLSVPSAMALYWTCTSAIAPLQSYIVQRYYNAAILNAKSEAQRNAKIKLEEADVINAISASKGKMTFSPDYERAEPAKVTAGNKPEKNSSNGAAVKKDGQKKKSGQSKNGKKTSSSDYQGKKKK